MGSRNGATVAWLFFLATLAILAVALTPGALGQQRDCVEGSFGCGHDQNHERYMGWHREQTPEQRLSGEPGMHCCKKGDCRPTRASKGNPDRPGEDDDSWYAWNGRRWLRVPPEAVLKPDILNDGRNHLCASEHDNVWCFSPTGPKG